MKSSIPFPRKILFPYGFFLPFHHACTHYYYIILIYTNTNTHTHIYVYKSYTWLSSKQIYIYTYRIYYIIIVYLYICTYSRRVIIYRTSACATHVQPYRYNACTYTLGDDRRRRNHDTFPRPIIIVVYVFFPLNFFFLLIRRL